MKTRNLQYEAPSTMEDSMTICGRQHETRGTELQGIDDTIQALLLKRRRLQKMGDGATTQQSDTNEQDVVDLVDETPRSRSTTSDPQPSLPSNGSMDALVHFLRKSRNEDRDLPTFSGDILDWPTFIQKYYATTEEFNISDDTNMKRLDGPLKGEAREAAVGLLRNPSFEKDVIRILKRKYGGAGNATAAAMETVENIRPLHSDLCNLVEFTRNALKVHCMITQCGITSVAQGTLRRIEKLIPVTQIQLWNMHQIIIGKPNGGSLDDLVTWLTEIKVPKKLKVFHREDDEPMTIWRKRPNTVHLDRESSFTSSPLPYPPHRPQYIPTA